MTKLLVLGVIALLPLMAEAGTKKANRQPNADCRAVFCNTAIPRCAEGSRPVNKAGPGACCPNYVCESIHGPNCARVKCMKSMPKCEPGEKAVNMQRQGECCPRYECRKDPRGDMCNQVDCAQGMPVCEEGQRLVNRAAPEACCPQWECEDAISDGPVAR